MRKLSLSLIILAFLALPVFVLAQADQAGQATTDAATQGGQSVVTEQQGAGQSGTEQGGASQSGAAQGSAEKPRQNSADKINVKLQIPLPFVPLNCEGGTVCKLTDYLAGVYRMLIGVGALFAVVMIIIAGYQWIFSGGSADRIGAAKKRIIGACMGLILALLSYVILNSISARLVELRLPLVDPVPSIAWGGSGEYCQESETMKSYAKTKGKTIDQLPLAPLTPSADGSTQTLTTANALCGQQYKISGVDSVGTCKGKICTVANTSCVYDQCLPIYLSGNIAWGIAAGDFSSFFSNAYVDEIDVYAICDNKTEITQVLDTSEKSRRFDMPRSKLIVAIPPYKRLTELSFIIIGNSDNDKIAYQFVGEKCPADKFKGFVLKVEVNDDSNMFWPTNDDNFALGKGCAIPLGRVASGGLPPSFKEVNWANITNDQLFSLQDFNSGATCNININRSLFPTRD